MRRRLHGVGINTIKSTKEERNSLKIENHTERLYTIIPLKSTEQAAIVMIAGSPQSHSASATIKPSRPSAGTDQKRRSVPVLTRRSALLLLTSVSEPLSSVNHAVYVSGRNCEGARVPVLEYSCALGGGP